jgi:catechol 2,3-dioxygenase-like lactoylglutathione lyase family enzyme
MDTEGAPRDGWPAGLPVTCVRFARPTRSLAAMAHFYGELLGLPLLTHFEDHAGYSGLVFGLPTELVQLEFTERSDGLVPAPTNEDLLVLYLSDATAVGEQVARLARHGFATVAPENPYWNTVVRGFTVADPEGFRLVLVEPEPGAVEAQPTTG